MKIAKLVARNVQPIHDHDCACCRFIGRLDGEDLYHCRSGSVIARRGSDGPEYRCLPFDVMPAVGSFPAGTVYAFIAVIIARKLPPNAYRSDDEHDDEPRRCSICDGIGHGYPGAGPCPTEETMSQADRDQEDREYARDRGLLH